ncbi:MULTISPECIES: helix-turn-helix transcriptional regulator [Halorussus]|uniref:helix-turn-helix transcriptional regulator n=1 Tax=Halorussus TaxID=1070314 RepID=UPI00209D426C|nr:hypothetical protein [Halorussus vallis]USZ77041.1 hypothetical protein NGM07_06865 [Halorussus vallis]
MGVRQSERVAIAVVLCLTAAFGTASGATAGQPTAQAQAQGVTPDTVVMQVEVHENGSATWDIAYRTRLDDPETAAAFRGLKADIENNSSQHTKQFVRRMRDTIAGAERATGREMNGTNFSVDAEIREFPQRYGVVTYSFRWKGFAAVDGNDIRVGDALSGLILNEKTRLLISWPERYEATTIRPSPDEKRETAAVWTGPTEFAGDEPRLVLDGPGIGPFDLPMWAVAAVVGVTTAALAGVGGLWLYRRRDADAPVHDEPDDPDLPEELLSNEERVLRLLERRGGRVKQKAVVNELGWTEAKTSQVVGQLREQGEIESFRLGRENVLALAQEEHNA